MPDWLLLLLGLVAGAGAAWLLARRRSSEMADTFKSLAAEALAGSEARFLLLAEEKFKPLRETLAAYQKEAQELEDKRAREIGSVGEQLRSVASAQLSLQNETARLVNALRSPQVRGRWGEITLRRTVELAGMSPHCDFVEQPTADEGRLRPDMIVRLPAGRQIVVDAKAPLGGFLEALEAVTDAARDAALARHADQVRQHVVRLASKDYAEQFASAFEFVVLFIPNDTFLAAAAEKDPDLLEFALARKIAIATPTTLIALLRAVAYGWRQELVAENAQRVSALGQELYERLALLVDHLVKVGGSLGRAVDAYNAAASAFESRVLPAARKFQDLGAGGKKEIEPLPLLDQSPRPLDRTTPPS